MQFKIRRYPESNPRIFTPELSHSLTITPHLDSLSRRIYPFCKQGVTEMTKNYGFEIANGIIQNIDRG